MSDENTNVETQVAVAAPVAETPVKRGRGRPKGSKNKPKDPNAPVKERKTKKVVADVPAPAVEVAAPVTAFIAGDDEVVEADPAPVEE